MNNSRFYLTECPLLGTIVLHDRRPRFESSRKSASTASALALKRALSICSGEKACLHDIIDLAEYRERLCKLTRDNRRRAALIQRGIDAGSRSLCSRIPNKLRRFV